jgi:hypothetical protein
VIASVVALELGCRIRCRSVTSIPRDDRDQLKREKQIYAFANANGWIATILDPGIRVTFREIELQ